MVVEKIVLQGSECFYRKHKTKVASLSRLAHGKFKFMPPVGHVTQTVYDYGKFAKFKKVSSLR